ncbi:hypothetical protein [Nodosilinea sp. P-1105]|uniref:hypothetical protein n=1 Tax=Nodosilinea sp. P-1105 TaxID=2546229 RepID=UPI00146D8369|nr:hypothetical protein [Nodosilinea sp. P-1105]NMF83425.1 hypothetical protein [Nodosilinea sp. P-1105]
MAPLSRTWQQRLHHFNHPVVWAAVVGLGLVIVVEHLRPTHIGYHSPSSPTPSQSGSASTPSPNQLMPLGEAAPVPLSSPVEQSLAGTASGPNQSPPWLESADATPPEPLQLDLGSPETQGVQSPFADYLERRQFRVGSLSPPSQIPDTTAPTPFAERPPHSFAGTAPGSQDRNMASPSTPQPDTASFDRDRRQPVLPSSSRITGYTQPPNLNQPSPRSAPRSGTDALKPTAPAPRVHPDVPMDPQPARRSTGVDRLPAPQSPDHNINPATAPVDSVPFTAPRAPGTHTGGGHIDTLSNPNEDW